ncbi:MAG: sigma-70 family RNA polymerase sigma factor [Nannocystaceae bacterium]|nr:sigma-70 family RNA polymerase sigma factor [Nannocystaceae bacterium]
MTHATQATDAELVQRWRAGDRAACEALFHRHYAAVARFFRNKAPAEAADLAQRTLLTGFQRIAGLQDAARFKSWILGMAYNVLREQLRSARRERIDFTSMSLVDLGSSPVSVVARQRVHQVLLDALRRIPIELQAALELHYWERMSVQEIADTLEIPLGTAKTRLRRARELVAVAMADAGSQAAPREQPEDPNAPDDLQAWAFEIGRAIEPE